MGVHVYIRTLGSSNSGDSYNTLGIWDFLTEEEVENLIDEKIAFLEERPWLIKVKEMGNLNLEPLCNNCNHYHFRIGYNGDFTGNIYTIETCFKKHFTDVIKGSHEPVLYCKDME